jgi:rhodanese-related sulfurtransferase
MQDLSPNEFAESMKAHPEAILLDVRTPEEYESGHLPGSLNIDIRGFDFHEQIENLDPHKPYYVYCHAGSRSAAACRYMESKGFEELFNLKGGYSAWEAM